MKRVLIGLAVTALTVLTTAAPATAAPEQVSHYQFNGNFAEAVFSTGTAISDTSTYIRVSDSNRASSLVAEQLMVNYDAGNTITGAIDTLTEVTSGFTFSIDSTGLSTASVSGSGLPATVCTYDADFNQISCVPATINLDATWTGEGPITHSVSTSHVSAGGFSVTDHLNGTSRDGTATGTVDGLSLGTSVYAILGKAVAGSATLCIGNSC